MPCMVGANEIKSRVNSVLEKTNGDRIVGIIFGVICVGECSLSKDEGVCLILDGVRVKGLDQRALRAESLAFLGGSLVNLACLKGISDKVI